ncbi:MAG TPA: response regulator [Steroidobacteraceae bacterium]|nr:response regulator [Steroidobacteraceae bacterium]
MKSVLMVDDEPALLEGLKRRLGRAQSKWEMTAVPSAASAIAELQAKPYDAIVTDMRLARKDGAQLLELASVKSPATIRIVLSTSSEDGQVMRLVPLAHQYIAKPCEPHRLEQVIERCMQLQELLGGPRVRAAVGRIRTLPTLPRVYARLREATAREDTTAAQVAQIISADTALTAKVLHVVNSAFFRHARSISRIEQAVVHLGFNAIRNLALSAEVFCAWPQSGAPPGFEPERLQEHAHNVASAARALARGSPWADDALLAGLLHDIGYWVLLQQCPQEMARAIKLAAERGLPLHEAERVVLEATHAEVGAYLLGLWGLPYPILEAVALHHNPMLAPQSEFDLLAAVAVAQELIAGSEPDRKGASHQGVSPAVDARYLATIRAPFDWAQAEQIVRGNSKP